MPQQKFTIDPLTKIKSTNVVNVHTGAVSMKHKILSTLRTNHTHAQNSHTHGL